MLGKFHEGVSIVSSDWSCGNYSIVIVTLRSGSDVYIDVITSFIANVFTLSSKNKREIENGRYFLSIVLFVIS